MKRSKQGREDSDWMLDKPVKRFRPDILGGYLREMADLEARGQWREADALNCWLAGHWMTWRDLEAGGWPPQRLAFLARRREARGRRAA